MGVIGAVDHHYSATAIAYGFVMCPLLPIKDTITCGNRRHNGKDFEWSARHLCSVLSLSAYAQ